MEKQTHGIDICDTIANYTGNIIEVPLGTVYPLLRRFINEGLIETYKLEHDLRKTFYILTSDGHKYFEKMEIMWNRYSVAVSNVLHRRNDT